MRPKIIYIGGMFENKTNDLFKTIKLYAQKRSTETFFIKIYGNRKFGTYSFLDEIKRIQNKIKTVQPSLVIAHSLGGYISLYLDFQCPLILLDPSQEISKIVKPNIKRGTYSDGTYNFSISKTFIKSLKRADTIQYRAKKITWGSKIDIFGAGAGGYKIAEKYHLYVSKSTYFYLPRADHNFTRKIDRQRITRQIKERLNPDGLSREQDNYITYQ